MQPGSGQGRCWSKLQSARCGLLARYLFTPIVRWKTEALLYRIIVANERFQPILPRYGGNSEEM